MRFEEFIQRAFARQQAPLCHRSYQDYYDSNPTQAEYPESVFHPGRTSIRTHS